MSEDLLGWLGFAIVAAGNIATFAFLIAKLAVTGTAMKEGMADIRQDFKEFRADMEQRLGSISHELKLTNKSLVDEALHGVRLSGRVESVERRVNGLEQRTTSR